MQWWPPWPEEPVSRDVPALAVACMHQTVCVFAAAARAQAYGGSERGLLWVYRCRGSRAWLEVGGYGLPFNGICLTTVVGHVQFVWVRGQSAGHAGGGAQHSASAQGFSLSHRKTMVRRGVDPTAPSRP
jgi:hypothetical protein